MDWMNLLFYFICFLVPALIVTVITWMLLNRFFTNEENRRNLEIRLKNQAVLTPIRLQAYERLALYLERITPNNLVSRVSEPGMSASDLKTRLINDINAEFNHNLSQQIYVSHQVWSIIKVVKEQVINLINLAYTKLPSDARGIDLVKGMFAILVEQDDVPTQKALDFLNREVKLVFDQEG